MMNPFKDFYRFSAGERRGILILFGLIVLFQVLYIGMDILFPSKPFFELNNPKLRAFQQEIDSLKFVKIKENKPKIYPFNPNFLTDHKAYAIGLSVAEYDRLQAFRKKDKFANSAKEFQQVTGISDSLLHQIQPFFKFPDWVLNKKENLSNDYKSGTFETQTKTNVSSKIPKTDLNTATKEQLMEVYGIGDKLSDRIIEYRAKLQGFSSDSQLLEVWNLEKEVAEKVLQRFTTLSKPNISKININTAEFKVVMKLPYMDYELTKKIFNYKNAAGKITSMDVIKKIEGFPVEKFDRICLYLKAE